jgi:glycosyltransferase involved in cell wall biosynthesis
MKVASLNHSDISGGAARAAYRIHHALRLLDVDSTMWVDSMASSDRTVHGPTSKWSKLLGKLRPHLAVLLSNLLKTTNPVLHSPAIIPSRWASRLNHTDTDVIHMHWVNGEMLSIEEIGKLHKPIVWTLHDMWPFCGAEHYTEDFRWRTGYQIDNRPAYESGFDLNRWVWQRKRKHWKHPLHIVTPSQWLKRCARESLLMRDWPVTVIPNGLDTDEWQPVNQRLARRLLQLPTDVPLLLFGAIDGTHDPRKGFDLLLAALNHLRDEVPGLELMVFGQSPHKPPPELNFPVHYTGYLHDNISLRLLYSASDAMVIPSRQDNLPNTGVEAHACGTPVVAFNIGGLSDIVTHRKTGYLAKALDTEDLAAGIRWVIQEQKTPRTVNHQKNGLDGLPWLSANARKKALEYFSYSVVAQKYIELYREVINKG